MFSKLSPSLIWVIILLVFIKFNLLKNFNYPNEFNNSGNNSSLLETSILEPIVIDRSITVETYFEYLDSIILKYDSLTSYKLTEHLLVRANPWIISNLKNTDYYHLKTLDSFVYNQKQMKVLQKGDIIIIPDSISAAKILESFKNTYIDVNIPEFKLRIIEDSLLRFVFPIRVGQPEMKFLKMANRITDLRTKIGSGVIINHVRNPNYYNPVDGKQYFVTRRDDNKITKLPQIPFIETQINGIRNGQLIHATTNPKTLEKAYSNGCIGTKEADAWVIYYYTPIGTKINIRYDLNILDTLGSKLVLKDIYNKNSKL